MTTEHRTQTPEMTHHGMQAFAPPDPTTAAAKPTTAAQFLLARIGELEARAREATPGPWSASALTDAVTVDVVVEQSEAVYPDAHQVADIARCDFHAANRAADASHIAIWDPTMALALCAAIRQVVKENAPTNVRPIPNGTIVALLRPFADHPDYNPDWERRA